MHVTYRVGAPPTHDARPQRTGRRPLPGWVVWALAAVWTVALILLVWLLVATVNVPSAPVPAAPRWTYVGEVR